MSTTAALPCHTPRQPEPPHEELGARNEHEKRSKQGPGRVEMSSLANACPDCGVLRYEPGVCADCKRVHLDVPMGPWIADGLCAQIDPEVWFAQAAGGSVAATNAAKAVCNACPVQVECLEWSLLAKPAYGIWGGMTESDRQRATRGWAKQDHIADARRNHHRTRWSGAA